MNSSKYPPLSAAIAVQNCTEAIEFYKKAFGAVELYRLVDPGDGKIGHAEITINGGLLMLSDEYPAFNKSPKTLGGTTVKMNIMSDDVDRDFDRAVQAGAEVVFPLADQFYGHRSGRVRDPFGHEWILSQEKKKISPEEMQEQWNKMSAEQKD